MIVTRKCIEDDINNPFALEILYRNDKKSFSNIIEQMHDEATDIFAVNFWYARIFQKKKEQKEFFSYRQFGILIGLIALSWLPVKIYTLNINLNKDILIRIIPIVISFALSLFFYRNAFNLKKVLFTLLLYIVLSVYYIVLPINQESQSIANSFYFGLIILWFLVWTSYSSLRIREVGLLSDFILVTGETIIWSILFTIGGAVLVFLSINLFKTIGIDADKFYINNIVTLGLCAAPFISLLVMEMFDKTKLTAILSKIFLPLFFVSIVVFGLVSLFSDVKPYESRNIFIIYNIMLVIVICLLYFVSVNNSNRFIKLCSMALALFTIALDGVVLSATIYRITTYGATPNKVTLLIGNVIMLVNLIYIVFIGKKYKDNALYSKKILYFLPAYAIFAIIVVFVFPTIFNFR